ncbi:MarR family winged helix-turn-helix transcriptional regulator [Brevibacillus sp. SYSU BS000544]|uniref:MarR family winged helix-turn-helix transcriptional regulator n=1 Tax=Brevibacillus sp. SYSU BS000544 TaxID=3416443 RepID=UPI003CE59ADF
MKFVLRDLPTRQVLNEVATRYPGTDVSAVETLMVLMRTSRDIFTEMESRLSSYGISQGKVALLLLLFRNKGDRLTPSELADKAGVTRGTITGLIDGLERDGLIERKHHSSDRRMITIHLTDAAYELIERFLPTHFKNAELLMSELTLEERETLIDLLQKTLKGLEKVKDLP